MLNAALSCFPVCFVDLFPPGTGQAKLRRYLVRRESLAFIPKFLLRYSIGCWKSPASRVFGCATFGKVRKLLRWLLVRNRRLARIVGPNRCLDARAALIAHQAGIGSRVRGVIRHAAATGQQDQRDQRKRPTHGLVMSNSTPDASRENTGF